MWLLTKLIQDIKQFQPFIQIIKLKSCKENSEVVLLWTDQLCLSDAIKQLNAYVEKQETQISKLKVSVLGISRSTLSFIVLSAITYTFMSLTFPVFILVWIRWLSWEDKKHADCPGQRL